MLRQRLLVGILLAAVITTLLIIDGYLASRAPPDWSIPGLAIDLGPWVFNGLLCTAVVLVFTWLAAREMVEFARVVGYRPFGVQARLFAAALVVGPYASFNLVPGGAWYDQSWGMLWLAVALGCAFLLQALRHRTEHAMANLATTIFIIFYAGGLAGFMTKLRMEVGGQTGVALLLFSMFVVKMTDTGAYFVGRLAGRHKLAEWLSPRKTWEGFFGGLAVAVLSSLAVGTYLHNAGLARLPGGLLSYPWGLVIFGLLMGIFSVAGDLCASLLKRDAAMKDSGSMLPGMGGILDVLDSALLAAPAAWFFWTRVAQLARA